jgi:hypothetical protein
MNEIAYIVQIWLPLIVWQQVNAPQYFKGYVTVSAMSLLLIVMCFVVRALYNRETSVKMVRRDQQRATESCEQLQGHLHENQTQEKLQGQFPNDSEPDLTKTKTSFSSSSSSSVASPTSTVPPGEHHHRKDAVAISPIDPVEIEMQVRPSMMI